MSDIKVGDRVRVVREYPEDRSDRSSYAGATGQLVRIDAGDTDYPYHVHVEGETVPTWMHLVERVTDPAASNREALVARAKQLLTDTPHTGADVIAMAAFLAGE